MPPPAPLPIWTPGNGPPPAGRFLAVVAGEAAPLLSVALPAGLKGAARRAVAMRQLRDRLGAAAEALDLRPAVLGTGPDGWSALLAADRADLARWRAALGAAAPRALALLPDYLALPAAAGIWTLAALPGGRVAARLGPADGFAAEPELAALMLARARARGPAPRAVWQDGPALPAPVLAALAGLPVARAPADLPEGLAPPRTLVHGEAALDLRRDPALSAARLAARLRALALPAALALAGGLAWAGALALETLALRRQAAEVDAATLAALRAGLIPEGPILDIRRQTERALDARRAQSARPDGLTLLHQAATGLMAAGKVPQALALTAAAAAAAEDEVEVEVELILPDFAALDALIAALAGQGLAVEVRRRAASDSGQVAAVLALRGAQR